MPENRTHDPFKIDGVSYVLVDGTRGMNIEVESRIPEMLENRFSSGVSLPVYLIAQAASAEKTVKQWVAGFSSIGVEVTTYDGLIHSLWGFFGDGRQLAGEHASKMACRDALRELTGRAPSPAAVELAVSALDMAVGSDDNRIQEIISDTGASRGLSLSAKLFVEYERRLAAQALVCPPRAAQIIALKLHSSPTSLAILAEDPSENDASQARFYRRVKDIADISVVRRRAETLPKPDNVSFLEVHGAHAYPEALADEIERMHSQGIGYADIALALPDTSGVWPNIAEALASKEIPFESAAISVPVTSTPLGQWFYSLCRLRDAARMRELGGDIPRDVRDEARRAINGIVENAYVPDELEGELEAYLSAWFSNGRAALSSDSTWMALFANAWSTNPLRMVEVVNKAEESGYQAISDASLKTDEGSAKKILGRYFGACVRGGKGWSKARCEDIAEMTMSVFRAWGPVGERVLIVPWALASYDDRKHIIAGGLDASSMSEYSAPSPFDAVLTEMDSRPNPWQKERLHRFQITDMLRHAIRGSIVFARYANTLDGAEIPASHLWNELRGLFPDGELKSVSERETSDTVLDRASTLERNGNIIGGDLDRPLDTFVSKAKDGGPHRFSPTDLETYWCCPRKWFLSRNGAGYDSSKVDSLIDARVRGTLVHGVLERYYSSYGKKHPRQSLSDNPEAEGAFKEAFDEVCFETVGFSSDGVRADMTLYPDAPSPEDIGPYDIYELQSLKDKSRALLESDVSFLPGYKPYKFEQYVSGEIGGVRVGGIVDRIDIEENPQDPAHPKVVIIDYKGSVSTGYSWSKKENLPPMHIQGILYALLVEQQLGAEVAGIVFRGYNRPGSSGMGWAVVSDDDKPFQDKPSFRESLDVSREMIEQAIHDLVEGHFPMEPRFGKPLACAYCPSIGACPAEAK